MEIPGTWHGLARMQTHRVRIRRAQPNDAAAGRYLGRVERRVHLWDVTRVCVLRWLRSPRHDARLQRGQCPEVYSRRTRLGPDSAGDDFLGGYHHPTLERPDDFRDRLLATRSCG